MPSQYCIQNPWSFHCVDPNYQPPSNPYPNLPAGITNQIYFPTNPTETPANNSGNTSIPNILITGGGSTAQTGVFSQTLQAILSGIALFQHAPYIPTGVQPQQQPQIIYANTGNAGAGNYAAGGNNTLGKVEAWLKNNTGVALMGGAAVVLYFMSPKTRRV